MASQVRRIRKLLNLFKTSDSNEKDGCRHLSDFSSEEVGDFMIQYENALIVNETDTFCNEISVQSPLQRPIAEIMLHMKPEVANIRQFRKFSNSPNDSVSGCSSGSIMDPKYITNDSCAHCALQGLDVNARDARINYRIVDNSEVYCSPFQSYTRIACEFPYSLQCFISDQQAWKSKKKSSLLTLLKELTSCRVSGTRVMLKLNDHLKGQDGVRGWLLVIEGKSRESVRMLLENFERKFIKDESNPKVLTIT